jgi:hypothetical protein
MRERLVTQKLQRDWIDRDWRTAEPDGIISAKDHSRKGPRVGGLCGTNSTKGLRNFDKRTPGC